MSTTEGKREEFTSERMAMAIYFSELDQEYNISIFEWCKAKNLTFNTVKRFLAGETTRIYMIKKILRCAGYILDEKDK